MTSCGHTPRASSRQTPPRPTFRRATSIRSSVEAIRAGAEAAAVLRQSGTRMRLALEDLPLGTVAAEAGEQASEVFGPFIERSGRLLRFTAFRSGAFLRVAVRLLQANLPGEVFLLIPGASVPDAPDLQNWTLAPGSIWIESRFLVAGATGYTGLLIAGGSLQLAAGTKRIGAA